MKYRVLAGALFAWVFLAMALTPRDYYGHFELASWFIITVVGWVALSAIVYALYGW